MVHLEAEEDMAEEDMIEDMIAAIRLHEVVIVADIGGDQEAMHHTEAWSKRNG